MRDRRAAPFRPRPPPARQHCDRNRTARARSRSRGRGQLRPVTVDQSVSHQSVVRHAGHSARPSGGMPSTSRRRVLNRHGVHIKALHATPRHTALHCTAPICRLACTRLPPRALRARPALPCPAAVHEHCTLLSTIRRQVAKTVWQKNLRALGQNFSRQIGCFLFISQQILK